jgi:hypothetical protein
MTKVCSYVNQTEMGECYGEIFSNEVGFDSYEWICEHHYECLKECYAMEETYDSMRGII